MEGPDRHASGDRASVGAGEGRARDGQADDAEGRHHVRRRRRLGRSRTRQHGEVRLKADQADKKLAHWQQIAVSACEQCGLNIVPTLLAPKAFSDWIDELAGVPTSSNVTKLILAVPPDDSGVVTPCNQIEGNDIEHNDIEPITPYTPYPNPLPHITNQFRQCSLAQFWLLIGAEGGFSEQEITQAIERGFMPWQIGERVLRTETAPVVALSSLLTLHQTLTLAQE